MSSFDQKQALEEIRLALNRLPVGTAEADMEAIRNRIVEKFKTSYEKQRRVAKLIQCGVREIYPYVRTLVEKGRLELENRETSYAVAESLKKSVSEALEDELEGTESDEDVKCFVHEVVREELDI